MEEYLQTTEICMGAPWNRQMCAVCAGWVGDLGALNRPPTLPLSRFFVCHSAALMRFHENSETEQVGVVAPGVGTTKLNREEAALEDLWRVRLDLRL